MKTILLLLISAQALVAQTNLALLQSRAAFDPTAQFQLGAIYVANPEPAKLQEGLQLLRKSSGRGNTNAMMLLADTLKSGDKSDLREALKVYRRAAAAGNPRAAYHVGLIIIENGFALGDRRPTKTIYTEAANYLEQSTKAGHKPAARRLASIYASGQGGLKNMPRAIQLWQSIGEYNALSRTFSDETEYQNLIEAYKFAKVDSYMSGRQTDQFKKLKLRLSAQQVAQGDAQFVAYIHAHKLKPEPGTTDVFKMNQPK